MITHRPLLSRDREEPVALEDLAAEFDRRLIAEITAAEELKQEGADYSLFD